MMLDVKSFQLQSFLPLPYEEVLAPRLKRAHEKLQSGSGAGGEFTGWVHLPRDYDREEFARIQAAASRIRANSQALVVIGIGGSYLGARGVIDCLRSPNYNLKRKDTPNIYFVGNGLSSDAMGEVLDFARRPPLAMEFATKGDQVMRAHMHQRALRLMEVMEKNGYSHIPVMEQGEFRGVFSVGTVFQYILRSGGKGIQSDTTVADLAGHIGFSAHMENYEFVPKDATYISVRRIFERVRGKNQRVSVIFITEHGKVGESLLGMLTPWDVMGPFYPRKK